MNSLQRTAPHRLPVNILHLVMGFWGIRWLGWFEWPRKRVFKGDWSVVSKSSSTRSTTIWKKQVGLYHVFERCQDKGELVDRATLSFVSTCGFHFSPKIMNLLELGRSGLEFVISYYWVGILSIPRCFIDAIFKNFFPGNSALLFCDFNHFRSLKRFDFSCAEFDWKYVGKIKNAILYAAFGSSSEFSIGLESIMILILGRSVCPGFRKEYGWDWGNTAFRLNCSDVDAYHFWPNEGPRKVEGTISNGFGGLNVKFVCRFFPLPNHGVRI